MPHKTWKKASRDERKLYVRLLRTDGHSDEVIGKYFRQTKGVIVGFRHRYLPELSFTTKAMKESVTPGRLDELLSALDEKSAAQTATDIVQDNKPPQPAGPNSPIDFWQAALARESRKTVQEPSETIDDDQFSEPHSQLVRGTPEWRNLTCQWPMSSGGSLKVLPLCEEPASDGLCEFHRQALHRRTQRMR